MSDWIRCAVAISTSLWLAGCATSFQTDELQKVDSSATLQTDASMQVKVAFSGRVNGKAWTGNDAYNTRYFQTLCEKHLMDCGMFELVGSNVDSPDVTLKVAIINEKRQNPTGQTLAALTLFIVPYRASDDFRMLAVARNTATGAQKRIELETSVSHWQSLFLVPLSPFHRPSDELAAAAERLLDHLVMEIQRSEIIQ